MGRYGRLTAEWVELVDDLAAGCGGRYPYEPVLSMLERTFEARAAYVGVSPDGRGPEFRFLDAPPEWPPREYVETWHEQPEHLHPLVRWYAVTRDAGAMTLGRVPSVVSPTHLRDELQTELRPHAIEQQLSIPGSQDAQVRGDFVLACTGPDFTDVQLEFARRLQPLFFLLGRRVLAHRQRETASTRSCGLSAQELRALQCLAAGDSAVTIGVRLGLSPRTVEKHVESVYRKLGVHDRVAAVLAAQALGLVPSGRRGP